MNKRTSCIDRFQIRKCFHFIHIIREVEVLVPLHDIFFKSSIVTEVF